MKTFIKQAAVALAFAGNYSTVAIADETIQIEKTNNGPAAILETEQQKLDYAIGYTLGYSLKHEHPELDLELFLQGMKDIYAGSEASMNIQDAFQMVQKSRRDKQQQLMEEVQKKARKNKSEGEAFLAANELKEGVITLASGLQYKILKEGNGIQPRAQDKVKVHYTGTLINGKEFDSSRSRGEPATLSLTRVIKGWQEALQLMPSGSRWQLFIPSGLAYGNRGAGEDIGPNATILFDIELIEVIQDEQS